MNKRIAVVGTGALGGYVGGYLAHHGEDVTLIDMWPEHIEAIRSRGLELDGVTPEEKFTVTKAKTMHLTEVQSLAKQKPIDIAFVSVKSYDTEWATTLIKPYLAPDGYVVSLQNCLNEEKIAGIVGWGKTLGVVASLISVNLYEPGRIRRTVDKGGDKHTIFRVGEVHGVVTKRVRGAGRAVLRDRQRQADDQPVGRALDEAHAERHAQRRLGARPASPARSATPTPRSAAFTIQLGGEAIKVGRALGYELEKMGKLDPDRLLLAADGNTDALDRDRGDHDDAHQGQSARRHPAARRWRRTCTKAAAPRSSS